MKNILLFWGLALLCFTNLEAQRSFGGKPRSFFFTKSISMDIPVQTLPTVDLRALQKEDSVNEFMGKVARIGICQPLDCDFMTLAKKDTLADKGILRRMAFHSQGATALSVSFEKFNIPEGAELYVYNSEKSFVIGKFTNENAHAGQVFYTQYVTGDTLIVEYYESANSSKTGELFINHIGHYYKEVSSKNEDNTEACEINVACSEGDKWRTQIKSVARMVVETKKDIFACSGSLINNVRQDKTQYFLTANHCIELDRNDKVERYVFYFNYQTFTCDGNSGGSITNTVTGAEIRANNNSTVSSDFLLLEITEPIPVSYEVFYAGWDIRTSGGSVGACVHHPQGGWKKISIPKQVKTSTLNVSGVLKNSWEVYWYSDNNKGVVENGSSGSSLFNAEGFIIGQLWGGESSCEESWMSDYYGKLSVSWNANSLTGKKISSFLDPDNTKTDHLGGVLNISTYQAKENKISAYPNPTDGYLYIASDFIFNNAICRIYNTVGQQVYERKLSANDNNTLILGNLPSGFYILKLSANGNNYHSEIIIK